MKPRLHIDPIMYHHHNDQRVDRYPIRKLTPAIIDHIEKERTYKEQRMEPYR